MKVSRSWRQAEDLIPEAEWPLSRWAELFIPSPTRHGTLPRPGTQEERGAYLNVLTQTLDDIRIRDVGPEHLLVFRDRYRSLGRSFRTWKKAIGITRRMLTFAMEAGALEDHPYDSQSPEWKKELYRFDSEDTEATRLSLSGEDDARTQRIRTVVAASSLSASEVELLCRLSCDPSALADRLKPEHWWVVRAMAFGALTGLRPQELLALPPSELDVDDDSRSLDVGVHWAIKWARRQQQDTWLADGKIWEVSSELKNKASPRTVRAGRAAYEVVIAHLQCPHRPIGSPTLFSWTGRPTIPDEFRRRVKTVSRKLGQNAHHTPVGLRHTYATLLLSNGVPLHVVSKDLGHKTVTMTLEYYADYLPDHRGAAASALDGMLERESNRRPVALETGTGA